MIINAITDLPVPPQRIVSLVPSQSELLAYLCLEAETVGITKFCVHPKEWTSSKAIIGGTKNIHINKIKALHPDLIIANKEENIKEQVEELANNYPVWVTDVNNLGEALQMIKDIGTLINKKEKAEQLEQDISREFSTIQQQTHHIKTAYLIWKDPLMTTGGDSFIHDMLRRCGLHNIFADLKRYPQIMVSDLRENDCRLLLLSSEPYPFKQAHVDELQAQLPNTKILLVDGEFFSWYGSRLLKAPVYFNELLATINSLHLSK